MPRGGAHPPLPRVPPFLLLSPSWVAPISTCRFANLYISLANQLDQQIQEHNQQIKLLKREQQVPPSAGAVVRPTRVSECCPAGGERPPIC